MLRELSWIVSRLVFVRLPSICPVRLKICLKIRFRLWYKPWDWMKVFHPKSNFRLRLWKKPGIMPNIGLDCDIVLYFSMIIVSNIIIRTVFLFFAPRGRVFTDGHIRKSRVGPRRVPPRLSPSGIVPCEWYKRKIRPHLESSGYNRLHLQARQQSPQSFSLYQSCRLAWGGNRWLQEYCCD